MKEFGNILPSHVRSRAVVFGSRNYRGIWLLVHLYRREVLVYMLESLGIQTVEHRETGLETGWGSGWGIGGLQMLFLLEMIGGLGVLNA